MYSSDTVGVGSMLYGNAKVLKVSPASIDRKIAPGNLFLSSRLLSEEGASTPMINLSPSVTKQRYP